MHHRRGDGGSGGGGQGRKEAARDPWRSNADATPPPPTPRSFPFPPLGGWAKKARARPASGRPYERVVQIPYLASHRGAPADASMALRGRFGNVPTACGFFCGWLWRRLEGGRSLGQGIYGFVVFGGIDAVVIGLFAAVTRPGRKCGRFTKPPQLDWIVFRLFSPSFPKNARVWG